MSAFASANRHDRMTGIPPITTVSFEGIPNSKEPQA